MKLARLLIVAVPAFVAGALLARRGGEGALHTARQPDSTASVAHTVNAGRVLAGVGAPPTSNERFGHVLSALQERSQLKRRHALHEALGDLNAADVAALIDRAAKLPGQLSHQLAPALLERWFELDAEKAKAWVRAHVRDDLRGLYWRVWGAQSPESALAEIHANPSIPDPYYGFATAIMTLAGPEKKDQASLLTRLPADAVRDAALSRILTEWATTDAAGAFGIARTLPAGSLRQRLSEAALREWAKADPRRAAKVAGGLLAELAPGLDGNAAITAIASALSKQDPQAALQWLSGLPEQQRGVAPYVAAASEWARTDPLAALAWSRAHGIDASGRGGAVMRAAMETKPLETVQWIQSLPAGGERDRLLEKAVTSSKFSVPPIKAENARLVLDWLELLPPDAQERAAYQLGAASAQTGKIEEVRAWTERLSDGPLRAAAVEAAVLARFRDNFYIRDELLEQFPSGSERDGALAGVAAREREQSPARAVQTAFEIADPVMRHNVLDSVLGDWIERSPAQARAWLLEAKTLPAQWKHAWLAEATAQR